MKLNFFILPFLLLSSNLLSGRVLDSVAEARDQNEKQFSSNIKALWYHYPIGSTEQPVTVAEYCAFLNARADYDKVYWGDHNHYVYLQEPLLYSDYYEKAFMTTDPHSTLATASILRTPQKDTPELRGYWKYSVRPGHENDIITELTPSAFPREHVVEEFNEWRKNPTAQELCDYINAKIGSVDSTAAQEIKGKYEQYDSDKSKLAYCAVWEESGGGTYTFRGADNIIKTQSSYQNDVVVGGTYWHDDWNTLPIIQFMQVEAEPVSLQATVIKGNEYVRPNAIGWKNRFDRFFDSDWSSITSN